MDELRALLRRAGNSLDQRVMYLEGGRIRRANWRCGPRTGFWTCENVSPAPRRLKAEARSDMKKRDYQTITGRTLDLGRLGEKERKFLGTVQRKYARGAEWSEFAA